jgi:hypothetical protein
MDELSRAGNLVRAALNTAWDRISALDPSAEAELDRPPKDASSAKGPSAPGPLDEARAREFLGVRRDASAAEIRNAYETLASRANPDRFYPGSEEQKRAQAIRARLDAARELLLKGLDPTERRFGDLEFD